MVLDKTSFTLAALWKQAQAAVNKLDKKVILQALSKYQRTGLICLAILVVSYITYRVLKDKGYTVENTKQAAFEKINLVKDALLAKAKPLAAEYPALQAVASELGFDLLGGKPLDPNTNKPLGSNANNQKSPETIPTNSTNSKKAVQEDPEVTNQLEAISQLVLQKEMPQGEVLKAIQTLREITPKMTKEQLEQSQTLYETLLLALNPELTGPKVYKQNPNDNRIIEVPDQGDCGFDAWRVGIQLNESDLEGSILGVAERDRKEGLEKLRKEAVKKERELLTTDSEFKNTLDQAILNDQLHTMKKFFDESLNAEFATSLPDATEKFEAVFNRYFEDVQKKLMKPFASIDEARKLFTAYKDLQSSCEVKEFFDFQVIELCERILNLKTLSQSEYERYFKKMEEQGTYAQLPEHYALAKRYKLPVCILINRGDSDWAEKRDEYMNKVMKGENTPEHYVLSFNKEAASKEKPWIFIEQVNNNHFNAVIRS